MLPHIGQPNSLRAAAFLRLWRQGTMDSDEDQYMQTAIIVQGRLVGPTTIELDEPASLQNGAVEIIMRASTSDGCATTK